uniref:Uncharacterized protein n=1 Tax=Glycine max TaxID=3847 RepID=K7MV01_SOYBN
MPPPVRVPAVIMLVMGPNLIRLYPAHVLIHMPTTGVAIKTSYLCIISNAFASSLPLSTVVVLCLYCCACFLYCNNNIRPLNWTNSGEEILNMYMHVCFSAFYLLMAYWILTSTPQSHDE